MKVFPLLSGSLCGNYLELHSKQSRKMVANFSTWDFLGKSTSNPAIFLQYIISKAAISQFWMNKFVCQRSHCNLFELFYELCYSNWIQHSITVTPLLTVPPFPLPLYLLGLIIFAKHWVDVLSYVNCTSIYRCWSWVHSIINFSGISTRDTVAGAGSQINR